MSAANGPGRAAAAEATRADMAAQPEPQHAVAPEPFGPALPISVRTSDREVGVLMSLDHPRIVLFGGLLSETECDELVAMSRHKVERSRTVNRDTGAVDLHVDRSSEGTYFSLDENPLVARIDRRIAELLDWPIENGEGLQVTRYGPGGEYKPHYDYFDTADPGSAPHIAHGGNRVATLVIYLATTLQGGATIFPDAGLEIAPVKGNAVFFSYAALSTDTLTLHAGAPVMAGEKWIASKWLRQRAYR